MAYTSNKKPGALDPALSLGATNNLVVDQNGSVVRATLAQLEAKIFDAKTAKTAVDGSELVVVRQTDNTLRQVPLNNIVKNGLITNDLVSASAAIADTKLATINTAGKVTNQAVQATALNTADRIVTRDGSGNFAAGTITATLSGNASTATLATSVADGSITTAKVADTAITTAKIADGAVTAAKIDPTAKINGAQGGGADRVFYENDQAVTTNYTITTNKNAMSAGPITVNNGVTVTVPNGSSWTIV